MKSFNISIAWGPMYQEFVSGTYQSRVSAFFLSKASLVALALIFYSLPSSLSCCIVLNVGFSSITFR